jgi:Cof subfamily protein (haloacid dehalogenase superfamily)
MFQLLALDVDGTLLAPDHTLRPRVRDAVRQARAQGIGITLATGKLLRSVDYLVRELGLEGAQITCNGVAIMDARGGAPLAFWPLEDPELRQTLAATRHADPSLRIAYYTPDAIFTDDDLGDLRHVLLAHHEPAPHVVERLDGTLPTAAKLLVSGAPERLARLRVAVEPALVPLVQITTTTPYFLEFFSPVASKGAALTDVMRRLDVPRAAVLAVGDGENDISLLEAAGTGVAMGNAVAGLRERALHVTASNEEDGVAVVIEQILAGEPVVPVR